MDDWRQNKETTREDFDNQDDWLRYLRTSGLEPDGNVAVIGPGTWTATGEGPESQRHKALYGPSRQRFDKNVGTWGRTEHLRSRHFKKVYGAIELANCLGSVMNVHMTIVWKSVGIEDDKTVGSAQRQFLERFRKWCEYRGVPTYWAYVLERGEQKGLHSHILASVPTSHRTNFKTWAENAIQTVTGQEPVRGSGVATINIVHRQDNDCEAQWHLFRYLMKGMAPGILVWDVDDRDLCEPLERIASLNLRPQGEVSFKRSGVSRSLDKAAQQLALERYGRRNSLDEGATKYEEVYSDRGLRAYQNRQLLATLSP